MKDIPDGSIDLVLTDPPYNIGKAKWDKIPDYINWCGKWIKECERVLKDNGSFYFWHNDMVQIAQLMEWIRQNTKFVFNSFCIWDKGDFRALAWKNPSEKNNLRSWFNTCEYCLFYTFQDETGSNAAAQIAVRGYLRSELKKYGNRSSINRLYWENGWASSGSNIASHFFGDNSQNCMPTEENYKRLQTTGYFQKEYEDLRREYEDLRYTHNLDANHNNVWKSTERNSGAQHACKKPTDILERIIRTSSKEGAVVLDCFMGSGSTGVACVNTGRNFIGIELDEGYFKIAQERIEAAQAAKKG